MKQHPRKKRHTPAGGEKAPNSFAATPTSKANQFHRRPTGNGKEEILRAYQAVKSLNALEQREEASSRQGHTDLAQRMAGLQKGNRKIRDWRRAAVNVIEDDVRSRQATESVNADLRESERRFRQMIDALPAAVYTTDAQGRLTHFNPACIEFSGRTPELGTDQWCVSWKLYHADGTPMPHDECPMAIALKEGRIVRGVEAIVERPDGTRLWFAPYPTPLRDAEGKTIGGVNMLLDITERKRAEIVTASLAAIVESSDDAIISKDLNGVITSWNKGAERLFGYMAREVTGKPITLLIPPDRQQEEPKILERIGRGERVEHFETVRVCKNGSLIDISLTISPLRDSAGRIIGASKIARDITERKRAEKALRASEERFRTLFDLGPVAVYSIDTSGVIQNFNRRAAELWGRAPASGDTDERFCGSYKLFRPDGSFMPHDQCPMAEVVSGKIPGARDAEVLIERPDGSRVTVVVNICPLKNEQGEITGAINCFYDITERKQAERQLALARAQLADRATQLEALVAERTATLQDTVSELEHFSYTITHDMRAPLRAMQGFAGILLNDAADRLTPESAGYLRRIMIAAHRMDALIQDSLQYAKIVREQIPLAPVEPGPVLRAILDSYPSLQPPQVEIHLVEPLPPVIANEAGLGQCFSNVLVNAIKFVKPGIVPRVRIWAETRASFVRFWFEDNGIGIPTEYQERIFGMFQQLDKSYEGTGIGLALVRKTAQRMEGKVGVESESGRGSRFWLEFKKPLDTPLH